jgi:hypothetical protein
MGLRTRISTRPGGRLRWPTGFDFGNVWRRYTACPMRRIALRAVPCQTTRQKQTKWVILKEMCFNIKAGQIFCPAFCIMMCKVKLDQAVLAGTGFDT